jgi:hypothetical protein
LKLNLYNSLLNCMIQQIQNLQIQVLAELPNLTNEEGLIAYRNDILGKSGELTKILK